MTELLLPGFAAVGAPLVAALAALSIRARARGQELRSGVLFERWRTWAVISAVFGPAILIGPAAVALLVGAVSTLALIEFARLTGLAPRPRTPVVLAAAAIVAIFALAPPAEALMVALVLVTASMLAAALTTPASPGRSGLLAAAGLVYVPLSLAQLVLLARHDDGGAALLLTTALAVALSDVGAFIAGNALGGPRLAPRLSPAKRWSGLLGNLAGPLLAHAWCSSIFSERPPLGIEVFAPLVAVGAVTGDLLESGLKRHAHVKDAGALLPGFGGVLDRVDSLIVVAPLVYVALLLAD